MYLHFVIATQGYCSGTPPSLSNAVALNPDRQVNDWSNFTCNLGYKSPSTTTTTPQYQCLSTGSFSSVSGSCQRMQYECSINMLHIRVNETLEKMIGSEAYEKMCACHSKINFIDHLMFLYQLNIIRLPELYYKV